MDDFSPSENLSGVEQLQRSAVIATQNVARLRRQLENEPDEFTRSSGSSCCCMRRKSLV
jgi:hypothetical protein